MILEAKEDLDDIHFERAMVIFAHPDDAEVQCAGMLAAWIEGGKRITYVSLTRGDKGTQDPEMDPETLTRIRHEEQLEAARELGVGKVVFMENDDGVLEATLDRRRALTRVIRENQPEVVVTHDPWMRYQLHPDHRATGTLALDAVISARDRLYFPEQLQDGVKPCRVRRALLFATDTPDYWVDIEATLEKKIRALGRHRSQVAQWPNWAEWMRKRAATAGAPQGIQFAEAYKRLILS
jgi:LmbE family N-acetylglucosaminyl deacetylase